MWRQGDVFLEVVSAIPAEAKKSPLPHGILVHGEVTGHSHRLDDPKSARLYAGRMLGEMFLEVPRNGARVVHEEHGTIELPFGTYRIWRQREYSPERIRIVRD